ncbi:unnamed protein product [Paramecium sonneborni]|uniref:Uncharacterized protein n=1 Tax=Paramecium sonneborni TaxID=65129 RepID=A0A8S1RU50_9CILI|nr:unnamed protein product [Paramecium sonneborni]
MQTYNNPDGQFESIRDIDRDLITQQNLENHIPPQNPLPPPQKPINPELKGNIFREMSINRKSEGFLQFKTSEEFILTNAKQHLLCSDTVIEQLDLRVLISDRSLQSIISFLKERITLEQNNVKLLTHKNPSFLSIFKDQDQVIYPKFSASLEHLNQLHQSQGKSLQILITNMEKMIKEKFETNINAYSSNINAIVAKIKTKRKSAREQLAILNERSKKFYKLYNEMMSNGGNHKKRSKDLFNQERKFKHVMHQQIIQLAQLGEDIIAYYNEIIKQESQRLEIISVGMRYYLEKFHETYLFQLQNFNLFREVLILLHQNVMKFYDQNLKKHGLKINLILKQNLQIQYNSKCLGVIGITEIQGVQFNRGKQLNNIQGCGIYQGYFKLSGNRISLNKILFNLISFIISETNITINKSFYFEIFFSSIVRCWISTDRIIKLFSNSINRQKYIII